MTIILTERFDEAFLLAYKVHAGQVCTEKDIQYISHIVAVAGIVLSCWSDEDQAIAALLHDVIKDGGAEYREVILKRFGPSVLEIIEDCTEDKNIPKHLWKERAVEHLERMKSASYFANLVLLADKVHHARSMLNGYQQIGDRIWERFIGGKDATLWYYGEIINAFAANPDVAETPSFENDLYKELIRTLLILVTNSQPSLLAEIEGILKSRQALFNGINEKATESNKGIENEP